MQAHFGTSMDGIYVWVIGLAVAAVALFPAMVAIVFPHRYGVRCARWAGGLTLLGPLPLLVLELLGALHGPFQGASLLSLQVGFILLGSAIAFAVLHALMAASSLLPRTAGVVALLAILAVAGVRFANQVSQLSAPDVAALGGPSEMIEVQDAVALTDARHAVRLYHAAEGAEDVFEMPAHLLERVICQQDKDSRANCHGWVFAGGKYLIHRDDVPTILKDNGYRVVTRPRESDLIVYRNAFGAVVHTGIVQVARAGPDPLVLVEGKWCLGCRYLHRPGDQVYSQKFAFYRSSRQGHSLKIVQPDQAPSAVARSNTELAGRPLPHGEFN